MQTEIPESPALLVENFQRLTWSDGDVFVITTDMHLSPQSMELIREKWHSALGVDAPELLVLSGGLKIGVMHRTHDIPPVPAELLNPSVADGVHCKGSMSIGNGCGQCKKCQNEMKGGADASDSVGD